jgi:hypothetical protein
MAEGGIDLKGRREKHLSELVETRFDVVVLLGHQVGAVCLDFPGQPEPIHWSIANTRGSGATDDFEEIADEFSGRVGLRLSAIALAPSNRPAPVSELGD